MTPQHPADDRLARQQAAAAAWTRQAELLAELVEAETTSREERMDAQRRLEALHRTQEALVARTRDHADPQAPPSDRPRAVLVHRNAWLRDKLTLQLAELGVHVLAEAEDGAEGLGIAIAEQPDIVLLEDRLPSLPAVELVAALREYVEGALVAAHVEHQEDVAALVEAGADAVFSRRVPPAVMADELAALLENPRDEPLLLS
jgi:CheY-like chemotaxis protein